MSPYPLQPHNRLFPQTAPAHRLADTLILTLPFLRYQLLYTVFSKSFNASPAQTICNRLASDPCVTPASLHVHYPVMDLQSLCVSLRLTQSVIVTSHVRRLRYTLYNLSAHNITSRRIQRLRRPDDSYNNLTGTARNRQCRPLSSPTHSLCHTKKSLQQTSQSALSVFHP